MVKIGQVYKCRFKDPDMRSVIGEYFYVLVCFIPNNKIILSIIKDTPGWVGLPVDDPIVVKNIYEISSKEEIKLFAKLEYKLIPHYQVNFIST